MHQKVMRISKGYTHDFFAHLFRLPRRGEEMAHLFFFAQQKKNRRSHERRFFMFVHLLQFGKRRRLRLAFFSEDCYDLSYRNHLKRE